MKTVLSPTQMRLTDNASIEKYGVSSVILMENAARSAALTVENSLERFNEFIRKSLDISGKTSPRIAVICGPGNNGGDGFAVARHLFDRKPIVFWYGDISRMTPETRANMESAEKIGIKMYKINTPEDLDKFEFRFECVIDAMIGVGGSEHVKGLPAEILRRLDNFEALKIAIDVPTGLNAETGVAAPHCFRADMTVTMFAVKQGMLLRDGPDYCGRIEIASLGVPDFIASEYADCFMLENSDIQSLLPPRKRVSSKYDYGVVTVIAGSAQYSGAAALAANSALKSGAGLVKLFTPKLHPSILPEVIAKECASNQFGAFSSGAVHEILPSVEKSTAVLIGPGLSDNTEALDAVKEILLKIPDSIPVVIDADGLRLIGKRSELRKNIILTPHAGEFARMIETDRKTVEEESYSLCKETAKSLGCTVLLKNVPTVISDGELTFLNTGGNPGMATGGSGDVLSGLIASLSARSIDPLYAAALGAKIHSRSGEIFSKKSTFDFLTASNLIECLGEAFRGE